MYITAVQPRLEGILRFQNGGACVDSPGQSYENTPRIVEYFFHVTHIEMFFFSEVIYSNWKPCLFSVNLKSLFKKDEDLS